MSTQLTIQPVRITCGSCWRILLEADAPSVTIAQGAAVFCLLCRRGLQATGGPRRYMAVRCRCVGGDDPCPLPPSNGVYR